MEFDGQTLEEAALAAFLTTVRGVARHWKHARRLDKDERQASLACERVLQATERLLGPMAPSPTGP